MFYSENSCLIIETMFDDPRGEFYVRGLADETGLAPSTVSRITRELGKQELLEINEEGVRNRIRPKNESDAFKDLKKSYNLYILSSSGLVNEIMGDAIPEALVLFGSYSRGEDKKSSDIDIALINGRQIDVELESYEEKFNREINIHNIELEEVGENFIETLANGVVLRGHLEL